MLSTIECHEATAKTASTIEDARLKELHDIITYEKVSSVYQPIINLKDGTILGYEALLRGPEDSYFYTPIPLFHSAESEGRLFELECIARKKAIEGFIEQALPGKLFINMSPMSLQDPKFKSGQTLSLLESYQFSPKRIVIELTEHHPIQDYSLLINAVAHYRNMGFTIALDDLGEGHSGLRLWSEIRPEFVKLDKHFITDLSSANGNKLQFVKIITELANSLETQVIAEGIEDSQCLEMLQSIQMHYGQGYYFARPQRNPDTPERYPLPTPPEHSTVNLSRYARDIVKHSPHIDSNLLVAEAVDFFLKHPEFQAVAVVINHHVLGFLDRKQMTDLFSSRYGRELNARKRIDQFIDRRSLIVSSDTPLEIISKMITQRDHNNAQGVFIITDRGRYVGLGYFNDLLRAITETKISLAKAANPLTGLPGNQAIENAIQKRLDAQKNFMVLYFDIDHFKAFNDYFGFEKGDQVITTLAKILEQATHHSEFIGHIGGDDFILLWKEKDWQKRLSNIFNTFTECYTQWYLPEQIAKKGFTGIDRYEKTQFFSLMTLSVGVIHIHAGDFHFYHQLASISSDAKKKAKNIPGNSWYLINTNH